MRHQPLALAATPLPVQQEPVLPVPTCSYREAHRHLCRMFAQSQSLAMLIGESNCGASYLIDNFLAGVSEEVSVVRISASYRDEVSGMSAIIRSIGFDPTGLSLDDLENVFTLFLSYQKKHGHRTILCIEETQDCGWWVINTVLRIVDLEAKENRGLMILLSGRPSVEKLLKQSLLDSICMWAEQSIHLANFTLAETREYLRWRVESAGAAEIAKVFEFDAITLVHELSEGDADAVSGLALKCLQLTSEATSTPVTTKLVNKAYGLLKSASPPLPAVEAIESLIEDQVSPTGGRLIVRNGDDIVQEHSLDRGHVLIGRGKLCDIRIASPSVSRHHALVISTPNGAMLVDLESTNGTFIDGQQIKEHPLVSSGVITLGDFSIDYVGNDEHDGWILDVHDASRSEPYDAGYVTQKFQARHRNNGKIEMDAPEPGAIKGNINRTGDKIYHVPGAAKYEATKIEESKGERWFRTEDEAIAAGWRASRR